MKGDLSIKTEEKARSEATVNELSKGRVAAWMGGWMHACIKLHG